MFKPLYLIALFVPYALAQDETENTVEDSTAADDDSLLSLFSANTGLASWYADKDYQAVTQAHIDTLLSDDYDHDVVCLSEINSPVIQQRYIDGLQSKFPYQYQVPVQTSMCGCTPTQYTRAVECLNATLLSEEQGKDYEGCYLRLRDDDSGNDDDPDASQVCSNCWAAHFDETAADPLSTIEVCNKGADYEYAEELLPRNFPDGVNPGCPVGDGAVSLMMFSKYPTETDSDIAYKVFSEQGLPLNAVMGGKFTKGTASYHVFCTSLVGNTQLLGRQRTQATEVVEFMTEQSAFDEVDNDPNTIVLLAGDFNTGPADACVGCVQFPDTDFDPDLIAYNTIANMHDNAYSIYLERFYDGDSTAPLCTSCKEENIRNVDDADFDTFVGKNIFGFRFADNFDSWNKYIAMRSWVDETVQNTTLTDKYAVVIQEGDSSHEDVVEPTEDDGTNDDETNDDDATSKAHQLFGVVAAVFSALVTALFIR